MIVPHRLTPARLALVPDLVDRAHHSLVGWCPGTEAIDVFTAHLMFEHGVAKNDGDELLRGVWCFNLGNVDATPAERDSDNVEVFSTVPECEGPTCSWRAVHTRRAYASLDDGAVGYVRSMSERYPGAFYAAGNGPTKYVEELRKAGYFTGDPTAYRDGLASLWRRLQRERDAAG